MSRQPQRGSVPECRGRPPCLPIRIAPAAALKKGRHRGLPLRAAQSSPRAAGHPDRSRTSTGRCELEVTPQNASCKTPPPNRLTPILPCPRRMGSLGAPTSSSAHGSAPPAWDKCAASQSPVRVLMSPADGAKYASLATTGSGSCVPRGRGWTRVPRGRGWIVRTDTGVCAYALRKAALAVAVRITWASPTCCVKQSPRLPSGLFGQPKRGCVPAGGSAKMGRPGGF